MCVQHENVQKINGYGHLNCLTSICTCITYVEENDMLTNLNRLIQKSSNVYKIDACCGMFF